MSLVLVPVTLRDANEFVRVHHRHHGPVVGYRLAVGVRNGDELCGVGIAGRPVARMSDTGLCLEVTRVCTNGCRNAASMLYGALSRAAFALGYTKVITYTLCTETGTSLRAAGWKCIGEAGGGSWSRPSRERLDKHPIQMKLRWEVTA